MSHNKYIRPMPFNKMHTSGPVLPNPMVNPFGSPFGTCGNGYGNIYGNGGGFNGNCGNYL